MSYYPDDPCRLIERLHACDPSVLDVTSRHGLRQMEAALLRWLDLTENELARRHLPPALTTVRMRERSTRQIDMDPDADVDFVEDARDAVELLEDGDPVLLRDATDDALSFTEAVLRIWLAEVEHELQGWSIACARDDRRKLRLL